MQLDLPKNLTSYVNAHLGISIVSNIVLAKRKTLSTSNQKLKYATKTGAPVLVAPPQTKKYQQHLQTAPLSILVVTTSEIYWLMDTLKIKS